MNIYINYSYQMDIRKEAIENLYYDKWFYKLQFELIDLANEMNKEKEGFILMTGPYSSEPFIIKGFSKSLKEKIRARLSSFARFVE